MTATATQNRFRESDHTYWIGPRKVPSTTQVIVETLAPVYYGSTEFHLQRGRVVHACAALVARKKEFKADPRVAGYMEAVRKFLAECIVEIHDIERVMFSESLLFGGTSDLIATSNIAKAKNQRVLFDYKANISNLVGVQLGAYSILDGGTINVGVGVQLNESGTYKLSTPYDLRRCRQEFICLRSAYGIKERLGLLTRTESQDENAVEGEAQ